LPEALVKGRCVVWPEIVQSAYGLIPATYMDSVDGLLCDPDSRSWRDQGFIIRERCEHVIRTAEKFSTADHKIEPEDLRGRFNSNYKTASRGANLLPNDPDKSRDVVVYYEIYSRFGIGHHLDAAGDELAKLSDSLDAIGAHVYLAILPGCPYPLNLHPDTIANSTPAELKSRLAWPIPFHADLTDPWPCIPLDFLPNQNDPWATSPLEGSLPLLAFIDHGYCYMMEWLRNGCKTVFVGSKALGEKFVNSCLESLNMEWITIDGKPGEDLDKMMKRIDFPEVRRDLLMVIEKAEHAFEQSSGMSPSLMGEAPDKQDRSATATSARESRLSSRPNDFADCTEAWNSRIAAKEALATRLYVGKEVIAPFFGEQDVEVPDPNIDPNMMAMLEQTGQQPPMITVSGPLTQKWMELVSIGDEEMSQEELEQAAAEAATEHNYTVEAGSGRRKNRQKQVEDFDMLSKNFGQAWLQLAMAPPPVGNPGPYNWLMGLASDVFDRPMDGAMLQPQQPQQPQPDPEAEAKAEQARQDTELNRQKAEQDAQYGEREMESKLQASMREMEMKIEQHRQEMKMQAETHAQEMQHREETHDQDAEIKKAQAQAQAQAAKQKPKPNTRK
jgi:hypothetical protein